MEDTSLLPLHGCVCVCRLREAFGRDLGPSAWQSQREWLQHVRRKRTVHRIPKMPCYSTRQVLLTATLKPGSEPTPYLSKAEAVHLCQWPPQAACRELSQPQQCEEGIMETAGQVGSHLEFAECEKIYTSTTSLLHRHPLTPLKPK